MARPTTKPDLLNGANEHFLKMWQLIDIMPAEEQHATFDFGDAISQKEAHWARDKNIRDVLAHIHAWHQLLLDWVNANQEGHSQPFLPLPYNWRTYGQLNIIFQEQCQQTSLDEMRELTHKSHKDVIDMINTFNNDALFAKGALAWTGNATLGSYCVSATASHYVWAIKKIKAHQKTYKG